MSEFREALQRLVEASEARMRFKDPITIEHFVKCTREAKALLARPENAVWAMPAEAREAVMRAEFASKRVEPAAAEKAPKSTVIGDINRFIVVELSRPVTPEERKQLAMKVAIAINASPTAATGEKK